MLETDELPKNTVMESDAALFIKRNKESSDPRPGMSPPPHSDQISHHSDLMLHVYSVPFADNTERFGYPRPPHGICVSMLSIPSPMHEVECLCVDDPKHPPPEVSWPVVSHFCRPTVKPALDFRYFTDPEDYDAKCLIDGIKLAREIAKTAPFSDW